ncbi:MAG: YceI family protein [Pedosphaera sp.]|nr:YceI family protein [Pedosphaera sp.]
MKSYRSHIIGNIFVTLLLSVFVRVNTAETWVTYFAAPNGSKVKVEGTSTLHDWIMESQIIGGKLEFESGFQLDPSLKPGKIIARVQVNTPVRSLKSSKDSMDQVMQQAMKQDKFPKIEYRLTELVLKEAPKAPEGPYLFDSKGELTIAGTTNKIAMPVTILRVSPTRLKVSGATNVKMTEYGVTPPAPKIALGAIKTGDDIKILFDWVAVQRSETAKAPEKTQ